MNKRLMLIGATLLLTAASASAQKRVTGRVVDSDGQPVVGASVRVQGHKGVTSTDANGNFTLQNVSSSAKNLQISYFGMKSQTVAIGPNVSVTLRDNEQTLDEAMVVAYGTAKKSAYTGAASEIKAEKIENRQMNNVSTALVGSVSGVQTLQSNGQPGSAATIRVRGISSINGVNAPLYVVDGVVFDGDISSINTQDIASITVLKDAVSTSLYGSRGSNGVIMVTTKRGQQGRAKITVDAKWGAISRQVKSYDVLTSTGQYYETLYQGLYNSYYYNDGRSAKEAWQLANSDINTATGYTIYTLPAGQTLIGQNGKLNPAATLGYSDGTNYYTPDDWQKETFKTTFRQEYNLGISGATDQFNYYASFGYLQDDGSIKGSGFDRLTGRLNVEYKARTWLTLGANMAYTHTKTMSPDLQATTSSSNAFYIANYIAPVYPMYVRDANGNIKLDPATGKKIYDYGDKINASRNWMSMANPVGDLVFDKEEYNMDIFKGNWFAKFDLTHGFTATARVGVDKDNTIYRSYGNQYYGQSSNYGGTIANQQSRTSAFTHQYLVNYTNSFGKNNINATAGYEGYMLKVEGFYGNGQNLYKGGDYTLSNATTDYKIGGETHEYSTAGIFFSGNYNYDERFYANIGYRRDATSAFHPDNRWGNFFNFGLGWNLKKESWLADWKALDLLKIRASFGQTGNDNHNWSANYYGWYAYQDLYKVTGSDGSFADGTLVYKGNKDLKWEKTNSFDFGVDYSFLAGRVHGSADVFFRATSNLLDFKNVAATNGYTSIPVNMGTIQNYGFEFEVNYDIIRRRDLTWNVALNGTWYKNRIHKLSDDYTDGQYISGSYIYKEGEAVYNFYLVEWAGVDPETGLALYKSVKTEKNAAGSTVPVKDENGNYIEEINSDYQSAYSYNRKATGSILPKFYGGLSTSLTWKGLDFSIQTSFQLGGRMYDSYYAMLMTSGSDFDAGQNFHKDILNAWTETNRNTNVPRVDVKDKYESSSSTRFLVKSNYFAIDNITLGYTLPASWTARLGVESVRVYGSAENLCIATARKGLDPRTSFATSTGGSGYGYGARRVISGGVKLTF